MNKEDFFIKRIKELASIAYQRDIVTFTDFLDLNQQNMLNSQKKMFHGIVVEAFGGYEEAERQMIAFHPDALAFTWNYPIHCLKIEPRSFKYGEQLSHRDYLGAILNLGIDRSVTGDIIILDQTAWLFCQEKISDFLIENIFRIRHTDVVISRTENPVDIPAPRLKEISGSCSSIRLDALISVAFQSSRSGMISYIEGGKVFVNGKLVTSNGYEPRPGDIISVRGKGRFRFDGVKGETRKGRKNIRLMLFC